MSKSTRNTHPGSKLASHTAKSGNGQVPAGSRASLVDAAVQKARNAPPAPPSPGAKP